MRRTLLSLLLLGALPTTALASGNPHREGKNVGPGIHHDERKDQRNQGGGQQGGGQQGGGQQGGGQQGTK